MPSVTDNAVNNRQIALIIRSMRLVNQLMQLMNRRCNKNAKKQNMCEVAFGNFRPLVSPKGWAGAGVGIGMVLLVGTPVIEHRNKFQMFKFFNWK